MHVSRAGRAWPCTFRGRRRTRPCTFHRQGRTVDLATQGGSREDLATQIRRPWRRSRALRRGRGVVFDGGSRTWPTRSSQPERVFGLLAAGRGLAHVAGNLAMHVRRELRELGHARSRIADEPGHARFAGCGRAWPCTIWCVVRSRLARSRRACPNRVWLAFVHGQTAVCAWPDRVVRGQIATSCVAGLPFVRGRVAISCCRRGRPPDRHGSVIGRTSTAPGWWTAPISAWCWRPGMGVGERLQVDPHASPRLGEPQAVVARGRSNALRSAGRRSRSTRVSCWTSFT